MKKEELKLLHDAINKSYTVASLTILYKQFFKPIEDIYGITNLLPLPQKDSSIKNSSSSSIKKEQYINVFVKFLTDKNLFDKFFTMIPNEMQKLLTEYVWSAKNYISVDDAKEIIGAEIIKPDKNPQLFYMPSFDEEKITHPAYLFFRYKENYGFRQYYMFLPFLVADRVREYLPKPVEYNFVEIPEPLNVNMIFKAEANVIKTISMICSFLEDDYIKFTAQGKVLKSSQSQINSILDIKDFFSAVKDKELLKFSSLRLELIIDFVKELGGISGPRDNPLGFLKNMIRMFQEKPFPMAFFLLPNVKGFKNYLSLWNMYDDEKRSHIEFNEVFLLLLKRLPLNKWVSADNLIKYMYYRNLSVQPIPFFAARKYLTVNLLYVYIGRIFENKMSISEELYDEVITHALIKAGLFLFSALGIVDIAFNYPKTKKVLDSTARDDNYKRELAGGAPYDNLKYVRLTELGAYLLGITKEYEYKFETTQANLEFDPRHLIITMDKEDKLKYIMLSKYARPLGEKRFIAAYDDFMRDCVTAKELMFKIESFKRDMKKELPENWKNFLDEMASKIHPLGLVKGMGVYKIKEDDELIRLIISDTILKELVYKVEKYHIAIHENNLLKVKKRLETFGYFL
ncbi:hypothetical protein OMAG_002880 [Candidatus Omnitrophus magneticus]|uniref:Helicase XPB/Ssl2 N-terminal domain-containing protein n=1 Tax=Candidatus Omnitrophus magneticus TaxID=1609969 RepID=A0A0F0CNX1_9BACT|nr:hypothetical protein OMAG_002880 [Candidatus Omnitrophus magneticus]